MTPDELLELRTDLRAIAEKATPGPWWIDSHGHRMSSEDGMTTVFIADDRMGKATRHPETGNLSHWPNDWDASFIATANPANVLSLLDRLDLVESALAMCVAAIDQLLPGAKHIPCDVGLINQALIAARPLIEENA